MKLADLSDAQLLENLKTLCGQRRTVLARLLAHLIEVEARRLDLEAACSSMFQFCVQRLGMSEDEACRRIHASRLARRFPDLLVRIERGDLTLSTMTLLQNALTEESYEELVGAAAGKTKAEVQLLLAKRWPKPDVPAAITTMPIQTAIPTLQAAISSPDAARARDAAAATGPQLVPLSGTRHLVQFTAGDELRKKLERAQDLMRHANAEGDLAVVVERAVDLLLAKLEKQRLGKASHPRQPPEERPIREAGADAPRDGDAPADPRTTREPAAVSRATRRAVFERDGERCTFTDADGRRCPDTTWLELDHIFARARGGTSEPGNLRVRCRAHNRLHAEQTFGKEHVERKIREGRDPRPQSRDPRQRGSVSESGAFDGYALAGNALVNMGFRRADVRRALGALSARHHADVSSTLSVEAILREALAVLT